MPAEDHELFPDEFMNDMLLNPEAYGMEDNLKGPKYVDEDDEDDERWKAKVIWRAEKDAWYISKDWCYR